MHGKIAFYRHLNAYKISIPNFKIKTKAMTESPTCQPIIIIRFLGTTPDSSSIFPLLNSLCIQISHNYEKPVELIPIELSNLTNYFKKLLESATAEKPLYIFLDSLDLLSPQNSAHTLTWMPVNLPPFCKFVVTTLEGYYNIVETFHNMIELDENFELVKLLAIISNLFSVKRVLFYCR